MAKSHAHPPNSILKNRAQRRWYLALCCLALLLASLLLSSPGAPPIAQAQDDCRDALPPRLVVGGRARVALAAGETLRLRAGPGLDQPQNGSLEAGQELAVLAGPRCADRLYWWQVRTGDGLTGWAAEGAGGGYFLAPQRLPAPTPDPADTTCAQVLPPIGAAGDRLRVTYVGQPLEARQLPAAQAGSEGRWWAGSVLTILSCPSCGNGQWWWRVRLPNGRAAWIPLGDSAQYYVAVITPTPTPSATPSDTPTPSRTPPPSPTPTVTPSPRPTGTPRPTLTPTPTVDLACWTAPLPRLGPGQEGQVAPLAGALRLRLLPSVGAGYEVVLRAGAAFEVLEGPVCNGGYYWYRIRQDLDGSTGWVAEGAAGEYWVQPRQGAEPPASRLCLAWGDDDGLHLAVRGQRQPLPAPDARQTALLSFSPNGRFLAAITARPPGDGAASLTVLDLAQDEPLFSVDLSALEGGPAAPTGLLWRPESSALLINGLDRAQAPAIWEVSLYGGAARWPLDGWQAAGFSPDGAWLALVRPQGWGAALFDPASGAIGSQAAPEAPPQAGAQPSTTVTWLADGRLVAAFYLEQQPDGPRLHSVAALDPDAPGPTFSEAPLAIQQAAWSPAGDRVAYTLQGGGFWLAEGLESDGFLLLPLGPGQAEGFHFAWSPTGRALLYEHRQEPALPPTVYDLEGGATIPLEPPAEGRWVYAWLDDTTLLAASDNAALALRNQPTRESFWLLGLDGTATPLLELRGTILGAYATAAGGCLRPTEAE